MTISRREFAGAALAAMPAVHLLGAPAKINPSINGIMIGAQTYSFRDRGLDECIAAMKEVGLGYAELFSGHVSPKGAAAEKEWRLNFKPEDLKAVRRKFDDAGIALYAFNYGFRDDYSDGEVEAGFLMAKALGVRYITSSANVSTAKRVDVAARKHKMIVAMHNHSNIKPNEFATPDNFAEAMKGAKNIAINLDIGHFWAAGFDPVAFLKEHHKDIVALHIKDRKRNQGPNMPFGEGDTPIKEVLQVLKQNHYKIPAMIEYEYRGADAVVEVRKCLEYMKAVTA
jgi:sugar phosphate isomerase/epimerase